MPEIPSFTSESAISPPLSAEVIPSIVYQDGIRSPLERRYSDQLLETAGHELNHALVALAYGYLPLSISVKPSGNSLGRTTFEGIIPDETFRIIAAGGAVETAFGAPRGYGHKHLPGSDFGYISQLSEGATNLDEIYADAISKARDSISGLVSDKEVLRRASAIIADMENVPGKMLGRIIEIAELEVKHNVGTMGSLISEKINEFKISTEKHGRMQTIIDTDIYGNVTKRVVVLDSSEQDDAKCTLCGEFGGHEISCQRLKTKQSTNFPQKETVFEGIKFSTSETGAHGLPS